MVYLTFSLIFNYAIILEKLLKYLLDTILSNDGRYSFLLTDLLTNVKHQVEHPSKGTRQKFYKNTLLGFVSGNYRAASLLKFDQTLP